WIDPAHPAKTWSGFAFTTYLSPPRLKAALDPLAPLRVANVTRPKGPTNRSELNRDAAIAERVTHDVRRANGPTTSFTSGLHDQARYRQARAAADRRAQGALRWERGYTASSLWRQPFDDGDPFSFTLKAGASATEGLRQWIAGLTIADSTTALVAFELDAVRA